MGGSESSQSRKVSFGLDERQQVRVLQGIRLSEDVVNRMKEAPPSRRDVQRPPRAPSAAAQPSPPPAAEESPKPPAGTQPPVASDSGQDASAAKQELHRRYEQEQALVQEELLRLAKREKEAASAALQRERASAREERQRVAQMEVELQGREAEMKRQEAFYKEQLARIERKNAEIYKLTCEQYKEAASKAEEWIKRRNTDPVCASLQAEILKCYQANKREVLKCSELAKEYRRCVSAAQKEHGPRLLHHPPKHTSDGGWNAHRNAHVSTVIAFPCLILWLSTCCRCPSPLLSPGGDRGNTINLTSLAPSPFLSLSCCLVIDASELCRYQTCKCDIWECGDGDHHLTALMAASRIPTLSLPHGTARRGCPSSIPWRPTPWLFPALPLLPLVPAHEDQHRSCCPRTIPTHT
ncbi:MICOS complex subunit MIC25 isoform X2 [Lathamus discolor]|uniref:MICOS complex subunit MIC25 isoform X2 n=1 Tax=Lathamus discolor TaxID=678569 RepID=UPI0032B821F2